MNNLFPRIRRLLARLRPCAAPSTDTPVESFERRLTVRRVALLMAGIVALAAGLRLVNIQAETYWADELLSLDITTHFRTVGEIVRYIREVEFHPPFYYVMLKGWIALFGAAEAATRSLSLVFALAQVVLTYFLGRDLFGKRTVGLTAAFIMAILPFSIEFGQEARPYAMVLFAATLAAWSLWRHARSGKIGWAVIYALATVFGLYLSYSYILVALATTGWWVAEVAMARRSERWVAARAFLFVNAAIFVAFYPWLDAFLGKLFLSDFFIFSLGRRNVDYRDVGFLGAVLDRLIWSTKLNFYPQYYVIVQFLAKTAVVVSLVAWVAKNARDFTDRQRLLPTVYSFWLASSVLVLFVASPLSTFYSAYFIRHVIFCLVPISLLVAAMLVGLGRRGLLVGLFLAVTLVPAMGEVLGNDALWDFDHRFAIIGEHIAANYQPGDIVIVHVSTLRTDIAHYLPEHIPVLALEPLNYYGDDVWNSRHTLGMAENELQVRLAGPSDQGEGARDGSKVNPAATERKLVMINKLNDPKRIWFIGLSDSNNYIRNLYKDWGWRWGFKSLGLMFPVDLFVRTDYAVQE